MDRMHSINARTPERLRARAYVVRVWPEPRNFEREQPAWRGSLAELDGTRVRYFDSGAALCDLLAEASGADSFRTGRVEGRT